MNYPAVPKMRSLVAVISVRWLSLLVPLAQQTQNPIQAAKDAYNKRSNNSNRSSNNHQRKVNSRTLLSAGSSGPKHRGLRLLTRECTGWPARCLEMPDIVGSIWE